MTAQIPLAKAKAFARTVTRTSIKPQQWKCQLTSSTLERVWCHQPPSLNKRAHRPGSSRRNAGSVLYGQLWLATPFDKWYCSTTRKPHALLAALCCTLSRTYSCWRSTDLLDEEDTRGVINRLWTGHITAETPDERLEEAWANAKKAVATYLLWATRQGEEHKAIAKATDELAIIGITLEGEEPDPAKLDRMRELNLEITELRKRSKPTNKQCFEALKHEERLTKEFFKRFKPKTSHSAIPELFITGDWDAPGDDARPTTTSDEGIRKEL
eukprot:scaffold108202_cov36-Tisochrysis_lutea.AAC.1